jgi:Tol biopolymer transport system component
MKNTIAILAIVGLTACGDSATTAPAPQNASQSAFVAVTTFESNKPVLFTQGIDGKNKLRFRFTNIRDDIPGNYSGLSVGDANLLALNGPSWDPSGSGRVAVVATIAYDQSEIVVMRPDGTGEVASVNTQIIASAPKWSPDGKKLAYLMATLPGMKGIDLFVTDLATHSVKRLTTNANIATAALGWSIDGQSLYYSKVTAGPTDTLDYVNDILKINVNTGVSETVARGVVGQISSISRTGARVLLTRGFGLSRSLIEHDLAGTERVIASDATFATYSPTIENSVLIVTVAVVGGQVTQTFQIMNLTTKSRTTIPGISGEANADVWMPYPLD